MPKPSALSYEPVRPVDAAKLKQAADRLADLLNDFKRDGWQLSVTEAAEGWRVEEADTGDIPGAHALVNDAYGYWQTAQVSQPLVTQRQSLAARLRALAEEVEAL